GPESLMEIPSVRLFVDRAQFTRPDFRITRENATTVAALCERLEGLPLALELAAAWVQTLTPAQMLARLDRRLDLLTSRRKDLSPRHRTLRNTVEWSYDLLEPELQRFFARMSVFRGSWSIDAAEYVGAEPLALEYLQQLQDRSLIVTEESAESYMRFRLLETLRAYAQEQLSPDERKEVSRRHLEYYLNLAEIARPELEGPDQTVWMERLAQNQENFQAALEWAKSEPEGVELGLRLAARLQFFWYVRGYYREGYRHLTDLLEITRPTGGDSGATPEARRNRALALQGAGELASTMGDMPAARRLFDQALTLWREMDNAYGIAFGLNYLGIVTEAQGDRSRAKELYEESLGIWRGLGDKGGAAHTLKCLGGLHLAQGEIRRAQELYEEGTTLYRRLGNRRGITMMLGENARLAMVQGEYDRAADLLREYLLAAREIKDLGHIAAALDELGSVVRSQGDYYQARTLYEEGLEIARDLGYRHRVAAIYNHLGIVASEQGDYESAGDFFEQGLEIAREIQDRNNMAALLDGIGVVHCHRGDYEAAHSAFEESLGLYREIDDRWGVARAFRHLGNASMDANDLEAAQLAFQESLEIARELGDRHGIAMALYDLGEIARQQGRPSEAKTLWEEVQAIDAALGVRGGSVRGALGNLSVEQGEYARARRFWTESLNEHVEIGDRKGLIECLEGLASLSLAEGLHPERASTEESIPKDPDTCLARAVRLFSATESLRKTLGTPLPLNRREARERCMAELKERLGSEAFAAAWANGGGMSMDEAVEYGRAPNDSL
ncbi:MAG: tetratricopeptide repeat protein, partial [Armatimonadetes bacterium]|nr:tetratricopeptide repeat protein [Armatimonadota bacterium]